MTSYASKQLIKSSSVITYILSDIPGTRGICKRWLTKSYLIWSKILCFSSSQTISFVSSILSRRRKKLSSYPPNKYEYIRKLILPKRLCSPFLSLRGIAFKMDFFFVFITPSLVDTRKTWNLPFDHSNTHFVWFIFKPCNLILFKVFTLLPMRSMNILCMNFS